MKLSVPVVCAIQARNPDGKSFDIRSGLGCETLQRHGLAGLLLCVGLGLNHNAIASDFTADYWPATTEHSVCPTAFRALPVPRFVPKSEIENKSVVRSDQFRETDDGIRYFTGNVRVQRKDLLLTAPELEWLVEGPLDFERGLALFHDRGAMAIEKAVFDFDQNEQSAELGDLSFVAFDFPLQGSLQSLTANEARVDAKRLLLSGCDPRSTKWSFRIKHIGINRETTRVSLRGIGFYVGKLPVFYLPYFTFRTETDSSGFDNTEFDYRSDNGLIVEQPISFIAKHADFHLMPRYLSKNGLQIGAEVNVQGLQTSVDWVPDDRKLTDAERELIDPSRWRVKAHYSKTWDGLEAEIDFTQPSDFAYQHDFEYDSLTQPAFSTNNRAEVRYRSRAWDVDLVAERLNSTSVDRLLGERYPELNVKWQPQWGALQAISHLNTAHYRDPDYRSHRGHLEQTFQLALRRIWGELTVSASKSATGFSLSTQEVDTTQRRYSDQWQIGGGLFFDKVQTGARYTVEPRLHYINRRFETMPVPHAFDSPRWTLHTRQLFGDTRTSGLDRIPGEHRLATGFRLKTQPRSRNGRVFRGEIAQLIYPDGLDGQSTRTYGVGAAISVRDSNGFAFEHRVNRHRNDRAQNEFRTLVVYEPMAQRSWYASMGKRARDAIRQIEVGFRRSMTARWEAIGAFGFDLENDRITSTHLGIAYSGCCYRTLLFVQRATDWDFEENRYRVELENRVMLRVELAGIGKLGQDRIESLINRTRFGFH